VPEAFNALLTLYSYIVCQHNYSDILMRLLFKADFVDVVI